MDANGPGGPIIDGAVSDMDKKWKAPQFTLYSIAILIVTPLGIIFDIISMGGGLTPLVVAIMSLPIIMVIVIVLLMRRAMRDIWSSQHRTTTARSADLVAQLWETLRSTGLEPAPRYGRASFPPRKTIDLRGGLNLSVVGQPGRYVLYVGPFNEDSRRDVERIELAIDNALVGIER